MDRETGEQIAALAERAGVALTGWQRTILLGEYAARRGGRATAQRTALLVMLAGGEGHVHVAAHDGLWCVTADVRQLAQLGPLWVRLREPRRGPPAAAVIYDEITRMRAGRAPTARPAYLEWSADDVPGQG